LQELPIAVIGSQVNEKGEFNQNPVLESIISDKSEKVVDTNVSKNQSLIAFRLKSPHRVSTFRLGFSLPANAFELYGYKDGDWRLLASKANNRESSVEIKIEDGKVVLTDRYVVLFKQSMFNDGNIGIFNIKLLGDNNNQGFVEKIIGRVFTLPRSIFGYITYLITIAFFVFITGFGIFALLKKRIETVQDLAVALTLGILTVSVYGLIEVVVPFRTITNVIFLLFTILATALAIQRGNYESKVIPLILLVFTIYGVILITYSFAKTSSSTDIASVLDSKFDFSPNYIIPYANYEADYLIPYGTSKIFMYHITDEKQISDLIAIYKPSDRGPLFSLFSIPFLKLMGDRFFVFEVVSIFISLPMLVGVWLLFEVLFSKAVANMGTLFLMVNPWLEFAYAFAQLRLLTLFFLALYFYFVFKLTLKEETKGSLVLAALAGSMAFLSHPFSFIYLLSVSIFILMRGLIKRKKMTSVLGLLIKINLIPVILFIAWMGWGMLESGRRIFIQSVETTTWLKFGENVQSGGNSSVGSSKWWTEALSSKTANLLGMFLEDPEPTMRRTWGFLRTTFPSAISWTLVPLILVGAVLLKKRAIPILSIVFLTSFITGFIYLGYYPIIGINWYLVGLVPLMMGIALYGISHLPRFLKLVIFLVAIFESLFINWQYFSFDAGSHISELANKGLINEGVFTILLRIPYLLLILMYCYILYIKKEEEQIY